MDKPFLTLVAAYGREMRGHIGGAHKGCLGDGGGGERVLEGGCSSVRAEC